LSYYDSLMNKPLTESELRQMLVIGLGLIVLGIYAACLIALMIMKAASA
jgi:hypothetical protein